MTTESLVTPAQATTLRWGSERAAFTFQWSEEAAVACAAVSVVGGEEFPLHLVPAVEIVTASSGRLPASGRLAHTELGERLRYVDHEEKVDGAAHMLIIRQRYESVEPALQLEAVEGVAAIRARVTITNVGASRIV